MRTLHLLASADRRGAEVFAVALAERLGERGQDADLVALAPAHDPAQGLDVEVVAGFTRPAGLRALRRRAAAADVVLAHGSTGLIAGTLATVAGGPPLVYRSIGDPRYWGADRLRQLRVGLQLRRAAAVTALWPVAADAIAHQYGVRPERIEVVPNAADERRFTPTSPQERADARRELGIDADAPLVVSIGALSVEKRPTRAIDAVAELPGATLLIAGTGPEADAVAARAAERLPGRHRLLGAVRDVLPLYRAADVVVLLSETEGQPGVAIEAGLCALPIVATDVGGVSSIVEHEATGLLVPADPTAAEVADALRSAIADRDRLGDAAGRRCRAQFSLEHVTSSFGDLLERVALSPGGAAPRS